MGRLKTTIRVRAREVKYRLTHPSIVGLFAGDPPLCRVCGKDYYGHATLDDIEECAKKMRKKNG